MIRDLTDDEAREALVLKWGMTEPGVLPAWVAEMDYAPADVITDALLDAEYLARAVQAGTDAALLDYEAGRDARTRELFDVTDRIASFTWTLDEARALHKQLSDAMSAEVKALNALTLEEATA